MHKLRCRTKISRRNKRRIRQNKVNGKKFHGANYGTRQTRDDERKSEHDRFPISKNDTRSQSRPPVTRANFRRARASII